MSLEGAPERCHNVHHAFHTLHQSMVTVKVGPERHPFVVHKERLCHYSSYFKAALTGPFRESAEAAVELPDQDVEVVEIVEHWLYTQKLEPDPIEDIKLWLSRLIKIFVFSDRFGMPLLKNTAVDAIATADKEDSFFTLPGSADIHYVYENTPPESPLRRLLVALFAMGAKSKWFENNMRELPAEFVCQVALFNIARIPDCRLPGEVAPYDENICQYHEHSDSTEVCPAKQKNAKKRKLDHRS